MFINSNQYLLPMISIEKILRTSLLFSVGFKFKDNRGKANFCFDIFEILVTV